ncbi:hypothetical protein E2C01_096848 [Portunus trituberculatus]|uniref:Uncharacterized protein n=1 Tax=Portunus trituberculatus TaxID=210409 RepID=A0A5B7K7X9_PORTR|nr:hypothetical protein [Portunus trituberculatus]
MPHYILHTTNGQWVTSHWSTLSVREL